MAATAAAACIAAAGKRRTVYDGFRPVHMQSSQQDSKVLRPYTGRRSVFKFTSGSEWHYATAVAFYCIMPAALGTLSASANHELLIGPVSITVLRLRG